MLNNFIDTVKCCHANNILIAMCYFNKNNFHDYLFVENGIFVPESLYGASKKRKSEYFSGRYIAKFAMKKLELKSVNIGRLSSGQPDWPNTIVGSISHSKNVAICAISKKNNCSFIGIDIEKYIDRKTAFEIESQILSKSELKLYDDSYFSSYENFITLCFSAKESIFKALYQYVRIFFGFECAILIDVKPQKLTFKLNSELTRLVTDGGLMIKNIEVKYSIYIENFVVTLVDGSIASI